MKKTIIIFLLIIFSSCNSSIIGIYTYNTKRIRIKSSPQTKSVLIINEDSTFNFYSQSFINTEEHGKWKIKSDTLFLTKNDSSYFMAFEKKKKNLLFVNIYKHKVPRRYYVWRKRNSNIFYFLNPKFKETNPCPH